MHFVFCAVYPKYKPHVDEANEVVCWPPCDDACEEEGATNGECATNGEPHGHSHDDPHDIAEAAALLESAPAIARLFVVKARGIDQARRHLEHFFEELGLRPLRIAKLQARVEAELKEPLANAPARSSASYALSFLAVLRDTDESTLDSLVEFTEEALAEPPGE